MERIIIVDKREFPDVNGHIDYYGDVSALSAIPGVYTDRCSILCSNENDRKLVTKELTKIRSSWLVEVNNGHKIAENSANNLSTLFSSYTLPDAISETCVIVSSGKTLDYNYDEIKRASNGSMILAVDSSVQMLLKNGIVPDMFITADANKSKTHFVNVEDIPCIFSPESIHTSNIPYFVNHSNSFYDDLFAKCGIVTKSVKSGGSVANMAFSAAKEMGFKRIILFGQDLCLTDNQMYAGDRIGKPYRDIFVDGIHTTDEFLLYRDWFEDNIGDVEVINTSTKGLPIKGTKKREASKISYCDSKRELEKSPLFDSNTIGCAMEYINASIRNIEKMNCIILRKIADDNATYKELDKLIHTTINSNYMYFACEECKKYVHSIFSKQEKSVSTYKEYLKHLVIASAKYKDILKVL